MPIDLQRKYKDNTFIKQGDRFFVIQNGYKRLICNSEIIESIMQKQEDFVEINEIECMRIPLGFSVFKNEDL